METFTDPYTGYALLNKVKLLKPFYNLLLLNIISDIILNYICYHVLEIKKNHSLTLNKRTRSTEHFVKRNFKNRKHGFVIKYD